MPTFILKDLRHTVPERGQSAPEVQEAEGRRAYCARRARPTELEGQVDRNLVPPFLLRRAIASSPEAVSRKVSGWVRERSAGFERSGPERDQSVQPGARAGCRPPQGCLPRREAVGLVERLPL